MTTMKKAMLTATMAAIGAFGCAVALGAEDLHLKLTGDAEVPPVKSAGHGEGKMVVGEDGSISGGVRTTGIAGTMVANGSGIQNDTVRNIILAWVLTLPVCVLLGAALFGAGLFFVLRVLGVH